MMRAARLASLLAAAALAGCAHLTAMRGDVLTQVEAYEASREYGKALDVIAAVPVSHPQRGRLLAKRSAIEAKAKALEQTTVKRAADLAAQNHWGEALQVYRDGINKLPQSQLLRAELQEFRRRQTQRVRELRVDQLVAKARWLERSLPVQESIVTADPDNWRARGELEDLRAEARDVATELTEVGLDALDRNDLGLAGRTLPIASRLHPTTVAEKARDELSFAETVQVQAQSRAQKHAMERLRTQESRKLLTDYQQAFTAGDLRRARLIMTRLQDLDGQNPEVAREGSRLRTQLDSAIKQHMDDGNSLYGRGKFEEAVGSWNRVLELDPDHEPARTNVERATRVLDKLKQLREKQAAEPKAAGVP